MGEYLKCECCDRTEALPYAEGDECWCGRKFTLIDPPKIIGAVEPALKHLLDGFGLDIEWFTYHSRVECRAERLIFFVNKYAEMATLIPAPKDEARI